MQLVADAKIAEDNNHAQAAGIKGGLVDSLGQLTLT
jgi:hypothetical protein